MKKLLPYCVLALVIIAASVYFVAPIYRRQHKDPRQQILGKWYFFANDASAVTFLPQGKLVMRHDRWEFDMASKYEFVDDYHIQFKPGAVLLSGDEVYIIRFVDENTMYLQSEKYGDRKYSRNPNDKWDFREVSKAAKFWRAITGKGT